MVNLYKEGKYRTCLSQTELITLKTWLWTEQSHFY